MGGVNEPNSVVQLRLSLTMVDRRNLKICRTESGRFKLRQNTLPREGPKHPAWDILYMVALIASQIQSRGSLE